MIPYFKKQNLSWLFVLTFLTSSLTFGQLKVEKWKLQVALGVNNPIDNDDPAFYSQYVNFPSINLGVQRMFYRNWGAKLDLGYNRSSNGGGSEPFKLNYTRINAQAVYDFKDVFTFLPDPIGIVGHAGPGVSITKPMVDNNANINYNYANLSATYLNMLAGVEVHYRLSKTLSVFVDGSYALALSSKNKSDVNSKGQFSFNGDLIYASIGVSISLDTCNYCP